MNDEKELFLHDWYAILGLEAGCSIDIINRAARKLAIKYHPDKTSDANATDKFLLIQKAKDILTDETKKKVIDEQASKQKKRQEYETQRNNEMDSQRKKFRDDLERRVKEASKPATTATPNAPSQFQNERKKSKIVQDLRNRASQMMDESREEIFQKEFEKQQNYAFYQQFIQQQQRPKPPTSTYTSKSSEIKVKWRKSITIESEDALTNLFGKYGVIEKIELSKNKKHSARIKYSTSASAQKAVEDLASSNDYRVDFVASGSVDEDDEEINQQPPLKTATESTINFEDLFSVTRRKKRRYEDNNDDGNDEETFFEKENRILQSIRDLQKSLELKIASITVPNEM